MFNFELLFLHGFSAKSCRVKCVAVKNPCLCTDTCVSGIGITILRRHLTGRAGKGQEELLPKKEKKEKKEKTEKKEKKEKKGEKGRKKGEKREKKGEKRRKKEKKGEKRRKTEKNYPMMSILTQLI